MARPIKAPFSRSEDFLLWLASADIRILARCSHGARMALQSIGLMVLLTTTMAFFAGSYAIATLLFSTDSTSGLLISIALGAAFSGGVALIYRAILAMRGARALISGAIFSLLYIIAIGIPVEWRLYQGPIMTEVFAARQHNATRNELTAFEKKSAWDRIIAREGDTLTYLRSFVILFLLAQQILPFWVKWGAGYSEYDILIIQNGMIKLQKRYALEEMEIKDKSFSISPTTQRIK